MRTDGQHGHKTEIIKGNEDAIPWHLPPNTNKLLNKVFLFPIVAKGHHLCESNSSKILQGSWSQKQMKRMLIDFINQEMCCKGKSSTVSVWLPSGRFFCQSPVGGRKRFIQSVQGRNNYILPNAGWFYISINILEFYFRIHLGPPTPALLFVLSYRVFKFCLEDWD